MKFSVPPNILYMLLCFLLMDLINQIPLMTFSTLAEIINEMNNHTLISHFGLEGSTAKISFMNSIITSVPTAGMLFLLFFIVPLADSKGRKYTVVYFRFIITLASSFCHLTSALFQFSELFILGQLLNGLQLPLRMFVTITYITECAPDKYRSTYSVATPNVLGKSNTWFIFPLTVMISSVINFAMASRLPESPKWLVKQNRMEEAAQSIEFYHGENCCLNDVVISYVKEKNLTSDDTISMKEVWENDTMREALKVLFSLSLFLLLDSGVVMGTYTVMLHKTAGFSVQETMNLNLVLAILFFPTRFIGTYIIDTLGRRAVMMLAIIIVHMPETKGLAVCDIIESMDQEVASRRATFIEEKTPLVRKRSSTLAFKRNSILNTSRTRALTFDQRLIPSNWDC